MVAFPFNGWKRIGVKAVSPVMGDRDMSGLVITSRNSESYWAGTLVTGDLSIAQYAEGLAFLDDCVDRNLRVDFIHPRHRVPRSYTLATLPGDGDATVTDVVDLRTLTVSGLPVGLMLKKGDHVGLVQGNLRGYRMIRQDVNVASGIAQTIAITPRLPPGVFGGGCALVIKDPVLRLAIVPNSWDVEEQAAKSPLSFEVSEALR